MSATATQEPNAPASKSAFSKFKIPLIILGIVAAEWLCAYLVMPSASAPPPMAPALANATEVAEPAVDEHATEDAAHGAAHEEPAEDAHAAEDKHGHGEKADKGHGAEDASKALPRLSDAEEVDLGSFTVSGFQPASNSTLFITFHMYGTVKHKYVREFNRRLDESQHRIRDNVIVIIRSADITDLTDAGLGLIKRRILETTNKTLGKPLLQEVVFSDFSFIEQ